MPPALRRFPPPLAALVFFFLALSFAAAPVAAGSLEDAHAAYESGDYATALRLLRPLADQAWLGRILSRTNVRQGLGVSQDYAEAIKWYRKAASQGYADAQYNLGPSTPKAMACRRTMPRP